ncbi:hypothetical protein F4808DRAFT_450230 [Astrocystis sublimbata]|nr:hypothetical protein F4808DRAFT_450230 [Astrocystis sublimbata]
MQSVPSVSRISILNLSPSFAPVPSQCILRQLIGAGTAVAAAATGLVFGQFPEGEQHYTAHSSAVSIRPKPAPDRDCSKSFTLSRPGTSSAASTAPPVAQDQSGLPLRQSAVPAIATPAQTRISRRPSHAHITPPKPPTSRHSHRVVKQGESGLAAPVIDDPQGSVSSNGSWRRRLSIRPLSQHGSVRSSVGPDSPSLFSFGSAAPILPATRDTPSQLPPNKLVKRAPGTSSEDAGFPKRRGSRAQMTLRRPATSHQRSATLQHQLNPEDLPPLPRFSFDQSNRPRSQTVGIGRQDATPSPIGNEHSRWKSFWHSKIYNTSKNTSSRGIDSHTQPIGRRIRLGQQQSQHVYLVTPNKFTMNRSEETANGPVQIDDSSPHNTNDSPNPGGEPGSTEATPSKHPKRSISMHFSSPTNWIARTSSLRRRKRGAESTPGKRHVSAPIADEERKNTSRSIPQEKIGKDFEVSQAEVDLAAIFRPPISRCGSPSPLPSPLPPLSRLSSFHVEENRLGSSSSAVPDRHEETKVSPSVSSRVVSHGSHTRTLDRASTVGSSEDHRGFNSGDDEDIDFNTDTPFDSFRTAASDRKRALDGPLDLIFDESPPRTAGNNNKLKRLSIHEILGPSFDVSNKIMEEDESASTPVRAAYEEFEARFRAANIEDDDISEHNPIASRFSTDNTYNRLSLDDDDDLGWARADEADFYNHLSPPSSMNSRRGSTKLRTTLGRISGNANPDGHFVVARERTARERPRSTIFDWTESAIHDKHEKHGLAYRPKTVHGKQELDLRGGRSASRKSFVAAHVRSQSVPVVPDSTEIAKSTTKFGTWGLGQKNVSEDWDEDFDFEEDDSFDAGQTGKKIENGIIMLVPPSIQEKQPTVKAHSGQIRELSLLVNDLKRLCRLGREMNMLIGSSAKLWHEAEGIIALASPDEDTGGPDIETADGSELASIDERFIDQGFDGSSLETRDQPHHGVSSSVRRRSVFAPDDDIFGTWDNADAEACVQRPRTPENPIAESRSTKVARSVMETMNKRDTGYEVDTHHSEHDDLEVPSRGKMYFDTNSLKELVKRAGDLRDSLSELVRREDHITQSPGRTPKHMRPDGSPAFTRVFDEPTSSPTRRMSHQTNPSLNSPSVSTSPSNGMSRRMQMMIAG